MNKLTKLSTVIFVSGIILAGCGSNKELTEKKENKSIIIYNCQRYWRYESPCLWRFNVSREYDL